MLLTACFRLSLAFIFLAAAADFASAQRNRGPVHTEPPEDDPAYELMGEFVGPLTVGENEYETVGLQLRPLGKGEYEAIAYSGGLPGQEKHQPEARKMIGRMAEGFLVLSGGPWAVLADKDHCLLLNRRGERVGRLERLERKSRTLGAKPPAEATVLFDGSDADQFKNGEMTDEGWLIEGAVIKPMYQDFDMHVEFRLPYMPEARDQGRGNSGVYIQSRYECQILDSFGEEPAFNGNGSLYRFRAPDVNASLPPLVWQTYDIRFTAPRWDADEKKVRNARVTAWLNGIKIHDDVELEDKTGAGQPEAPTLLPIKLQNHSDPVRFRNIWVIDRGLSPLPDFPVEGNGEEEAAEEKDAAADETEKDEEPKKDKDAKDNEAESKDSDGDKTKSEDKKESDKKESEEKDSEENKEKRDEQNDADGDNGEDSSG